MKIENIAGEHIADAARRAVALVEGGEAEVTFEFNDIEMVVKAGASVGDVCADYARQSKARYDAAEAEAEAGQARQREKDSDYRGALARAPRAMSIRAGLESTWEHIQQVNGSDSYNKRCVTYAEEWARLMEADNKRGRTIAQCAEWCSRVADHDSITGFMYGAAVSILAQVWAHGEELRRWHNKETQLGTEGDQANEEGGVLNPALLKIG